MIVFYRSRAIEYLSNYNLSAINMFTKDLKESENATSSMQYPSFATVASGNPRVESKHQMDAPNGHYKKYRYKTVAANWRNKTRSKSDEESSEEDNTTKEIDSRTFLRPSPGVDRQNIITTRQTITSDAAKEVKKEEVTEDRLESGIAWAEHDSSSRESSILDVNNDQMFDDSIFTEYDDKNISTMSHKMSKHWQKKIKDEDRCQSRKLRGDKLSIEKLVQQQIEKSKVRKQEVGKNINIKKPSTLGQKLNVTDNRRQRTKSNRERYYDHGLRNNSTVGEY